MPRSVEEVSMDIEAAEDKLRALQEKRRLLRSELHEAWIAEAEANPHPWLGKKLSRFDKQNWGKGRRQTGTLKIADEKSIRLRNFYGRPGDLVVVSSSGLTGYAFSEGRGWELAE